MDGTHAFTDVDFELIDFLCKIISLELQKSDFYRTNQGLMHSYFLSDLLDNKVHDSAAIEQRMTNLGWKLNSNLHILLISDLARNFFDGKAQLITSQLHRLLPSSRWVIYHGQIVFLLSSDTPKIFAETEELYHYLEINHLTASISNSFDSILDIRKYYLQAAKAEAFGQRFRPHVPMHFYSDYMFHHMGEIVSEKHSLVDFYHPEIVAIRDYDMAHNTNFLETLKLYLIHIDNPGAIAKQLFIHKNTVFYRISKLKEQFHLNLDDGDERFKIHLTIKLMEMET
jgi:sugar diacid utilization regulator